MLFALTSPHWKLASRLSSLAVFIVLLMLVWRVASVLVIADAVLRWALAFVIVQFSVLGALTVGIVANKIRWTRREAASARRLAHIQQRLADAVFGDARANLGEASGTPEFLAAVGQSLDVLAGSARWRVEQILEQSAVYPDLLDRALDPQPLRAIQAIVLLGKLREHRAGRAIERALDHPETLVRAAARRALLGSGQDAAIRRVLAGLPTLPAWERMILFQCVPANAPALADFLSDSLASNAPARILPALEYILSAQRSALVEAPASLALHPDLEVRIKFFRALPYLEVGPGLQPALDSGLADPDWRVRAMTARACGHYRVRRLVPRLLELLRSAEQPAEAGHAARALAALGGHSLRELMTLTGSDREIVRRTAASVIERRMLDFQPTE